MIDEKTILQWELDAEEAGLNQHAEIIRLARRYLALRKNCGVFMLSNGSGCNKSCLDAAADRLLEGGE
jgi:hypothetical protein